MGIVYASVPAGSIVTLPETERSAYIQQLLTLPTAARQLMTSNQAGAFTRGLAKSYSLPVERAADIAFTIVKVALGKVSLAELPWALAATLKLPESQAQRMAYEIEQDLLAPIRQALEEYWQVQKAHSQPGKHIGSTRMPSLGLPALPGAAHSQGKIRSANPTLDVKAERKLPPAPPTLDR
jgi:hypothetical protein